MEWTWKLCELLFWAHPLFRASRLLASVVSQLPQQQQLPHHHVAYPASPVWPGMPAAPARRWAQTPYFTFPVPFGWRECEAFERNLLAQGDASDLECAFVTDRTDRFTTNLLVYVSARSTVALESNSQQFVTEYARGSQIIDGPYTRAIGQRPAVVFRVRPVRDGTSFGRPGPLALVQSVAAVQNGSDIYAIVLSGPEEAHLYCLPMLQCALDGWQW